MTTITDGRKARRSSLFGGALLAAAVALSALFVAPVTAANAGGCALWVCGQGATNFTSAKSVRFADNWSDSLGRPPAGSGYTTVLPGKSTPSGIDWDGFEVPAGWCGTYWTKDYFTGVSSGILKVDRRTATTSKWVKFTTNQKAFVELDKNCTYNKA